MLAVEFGAQDAVGEGFPAPASSKAPSALSVAAAASFACGATPFKMALSAPRQAASRGQGLRRHERHAVLAGLTFVRVVGYGHGGHGVEGVLLGFGQATHEAQVVAERMAFGELREAARAMGEDVPSRRVSGRAGRRPWPGEFGRVLGSVVIFKPSMETSSPL
jgi:hypothetical protein